MNRDTARRVLATALPERRVEALAPTATGNTKRTFLATLDGADRVVVHLHPAPEHLRLEAALAHAIAARTSLRVPAVRATGRLDGAGYLVADYAPGVDLHERFTTLPPDERRSVVAAFGRALGTLHETFRFTGHGRLTLDDQEDWDDRNGREDRVDPLPDGHRLTVADPQSWPSWFDTLANEGLAALPDSLADQRGRVAAALDDFSPDDAPATLFPWDLRPGNARYAEDAGENVDADQSAEDATVDTPTGTAAAERLTLIDWGDPLTAHAEFSLAKAEYVVVDWYAPSPALRAAFHDGYREARTLAADYRAARRPYYRLAAIVRTAVDARGVVTRPGYPERDGDQAMAFHRAHLDRVLRTLENE
ncbi:phosphotransferase [Halomarina salina]|uniref:Phosphotransferase n=1 Tax=Halomarina salina TaxID=1872699 RepID=A0ABD5RP14_9EURY